ncbi:hypothetical protein C9374_014555 [Naegleria lovaniensis]|uniref:Uncharacterized protein n=1 Tax=Naegleria lovaniensis TaxID=51637 RepID=A0AA88KMP0_NAELO|nr:uncharacterized protein C9374_014555 [Naegleria lovaniensis]KAG2389155.1 hypothetical protein C9374_014555 [Naegleria lovaniensis]
MHSAIHSLVSVFIMLMFVAVHACSIYNVHSYTQPGIFEAFLSNVSSNNLIIHGSGFGSYSPMIFWDHPADQEHDNNALSKWKEIKALSLTSNCTTRSGNNNTIYYGKGFHSTLGIPQHPAGSVYDRLYVSWWYKPGQSPDSEGGSNKFIRVWDDFNGYGTRISWTHMHLTCENGTYWNAWTSKGLINEWNHHEFHVDLSQKKVLAYVNGKLHIKATCHKNEKQVGKPLYIQLIGFDHGDLAYKNMTTSLDDVYIGNSTRRVVISKSSTWNDIIWSETLPVVEWSDRKIVVKFIEGTFKNPSLLMDSTDKLYVYVVGENGMPLSNNGTLIAQSSSQQNEPSRSVVKSQPSRIPGREYSQQASKSTHHNTSATLLPPVGNYFACLVLFLLICY